MCRAESNVCCSVLWFCFAQMLLPPGGVHTAEAVSLSDAKSQRWRSRPSDDRYDRDFVVARALLLGRQLVLHPSHEVTPPYVCGTSTCPHIVLRLTAIEDISMLLKQGSMAIVMGGAVQSLSAPLSHGLATAAQSFGATTVKHAMLVLPLKALWASKEEPHSLC